MSTGTRAPRSAWVGVVMAVALVAGTVWAEDPFPAKVVEVASGDFLTIERDGARKPLRLAGVDCPETGQPFADEAKKFVLDKVLGKMVTVTVLTKDNKEISVGDVVLEDGKNLGHLLVQSGHAWWDKAHVPEDPKLKGLNAQAITDGKGLWSDPLALSPSDYRKSHGIEQFHYLIKPEEEAPPVVIAPTEEEPKSISAKGDDIYKGGFSVDLKDFDLGAIEKIKPEELVMKHMPTVAKNDSGAPIGLAVPNISQIPYASQLGFQDGDVVTGVNGHQVRDMGQAYGLVNRLKGAKTITIEILRNGQPQKRTFRLP